MLILNLTKSAAGQYPAIQIYGGPEIPKGYAWWPDSLEQTTFDQYEGFIVPVVRRNTVASYTANEEAYEAWKEAHPKPEPESTDTEVLNALLGVIE